MAVKRTFTGMQKDEIRRKLAKVKKKMKDIKAYRRLQALRMYSQGTPNKTIAEALEYNEYYISELVSKYINEGIEAIVNDKRTSNNRKMSYEKEAEFLEGFRERAEAGELLTIKDILLKYEEETGEASGTSTIYALLKRHGWRKLKPRPENPKKAGFGRISDIASCWAPPKKRPTVPFAQIREYKNMYGAVSPIDGECFFMVLDKCDSEHMTLFLAELSKLYHNELILLCLDRASYHTSKILVVPSNIRLFHIPPCTPEMNPVEVLWREIRKIGFKNKIFDSLQSVVDKFDEVVNSMPNSDIISITCWDWIARIIVA